MVIPDGESRQSGDGRGFSLEEQARVGIPGTGDPALACPKQARNLGKSSAQVNGAGSAWTIPGHSWSNPGLKHVQNRTIRDFQQPDASRTAPPGFSDG